jgi:catechol 2,3-dioxygenase-like lactoylglutathione lyase family enzyme
MVTIFVSNIDVSIRFYTEVLGMKLGNRYGNEFAIVQANNGLTIGLHPASAKSPAGKVTIGIESPEPIRSAVAKLKEKGVKFITPIIDDKEILAADFVDPNGAELYIVEVKQSWQSST